MIWLTGGTSNVASVTFSAPVVNPVLAIVSLGHAGTPASFVFNDNEPFAIESGGPSARYGGSSITASGNTVSGEEGSGTIQFFGTYIKLSWTNPLSEQFYGFTVGIDPPSSPVPEPATWMLMLVGFAGLGFAVRRGSRVKSVSA